jgi:phage gpG-like protein
VVAVNYTIKDLTGRKMLTQAERRMADPKTALKECGLVLIRSIARNFKAGGRPVRWHPSKRALAEGGKTLLDTARLKNSISIQVIRKTSIKVGTAVKYARIHQLGGKLDKNVTIKQHYRTITRAFGKPIDERKVLVRQHQRQQDMYIPARPFLMVQDADLRIMRRIVADYVSMKG